MVDDKEYKHARSYFMGLYRSHIERARSWRGLNSRQVAWSLELAADCRAKLIYGAQIRKVKPA